MMRRIVWGRVGPALLGLWLIANAGYAHDIWITTMTDEAGAQRAVLNHGHPGDRKAPDPDKLFEWTVIGGKESGRSLLPGLRGVQLDGIPVLLSAPLAEPDETGPRAVGARYDNGFWVRTPLGYRNASKREVPEADESLWSTKYAKLLLPTSGPLGERSPAVLGHRLELIPEDNPFTIRPGGTLRIRVLFSGQPLPGVQVETGDGVTPLEEAKVPRYPTDENGIATIPIVKPGWQLMVVDYMIPSRHPELAARELHNATLSFVIPSP